MFKNCLVALAMVFALACVLSVEAAEQLNLLPMPYGISAVQDSCSNLTLSSRISGSGYYRGIKLCGRVKVVSSFPDIKVKVVSSFPDLRVKRVASFADSVGEWQFVDSFPDFTIKFVDSFEDIRIKFVDSFPGVG